MPSNEADFISKIRQQIAFLKDEEYSYDELRVYVSGISEPWIFEPVDEFEIEGQEVLVIRSGPIDENNNEGVAEYVFPLRHIVATELGFSGE